MRNMFRIFVNSREDKRKFKVRGQRRKLQSLLREIEQIEPYKRTDRSFEHFHVPCSPWIEMPGTSGRVKTAFCRAWIAKTEEIIRNKPDSLPFCKVAAMLSYPDLHESEIIIFYDKKYYDSFWKRDGDDQKWTRIENGRSFTGDRGISTKLHESEYFEEIFDEDTDFTERVYTAHLWVYTEDAIV